MPITPTYPGVYIEEVASGVRPIAGVATSITAFVGRANRGPVNDPITLNSWADFERVFGGLDADSTLSYAIRDFFINGGSQAIVVRLYAPSFADEAARLVAFNAAKTRATAAANDVKTAVTNEAAAVNATAQTVQGKADAAVANEPANDAAKVVGAQYVADAVRLVSTGLPTVAEVSKAGTDQADALKASATDRKTGAAAALAAITGAPAGKTPDQLATLATTAANGLPNNDQKQAGLAVAAAAKAGSDEADARAKAQAANDAISAQSTAEGPALDAVRKAITDSAATNPHVFDLATAAETAARVQSLGNPAVKPVVDLVAQATRARTTQPPSPATVAAAVTPAVIAAAANAGASAIAPIANATLTVGGLQLVAASPGTWGNNLRARITTEVLSGDAKTFNLYLIDTGTGQTEEFLNVSTDPNSNRYVTSVLANGSTLVTATAVPGLPQPSEPIATKGVTSLKDRWNDTNSSKVQTDGQGSDGAELSMADYQGRGIPKQGIYALEKADLFNILCIPPYTLSKDIDAGLIDEAISYCIDRRAIMVVDPPSTWLTKDQAKAGMAALAFAKSDHAALYWPMLRQPDPLRDNRPGNFAPCGTIAGIMSRTDTQRGVWKAPAGLETIMMGVPELSVSLTDPENGELNPLALNCLRVKPGVGRVVWGARTLAGDDRNPNDYKYIPVRRLALYIEESLYRGMQWVVFEPNDDPLWSQIRLNVGSFLHTLFRQGAFAGSTPASAYFVKCDHDTTTQADVDNGIVNVIVGFAPLKPAEFVILKLEQITRGQDS